MEKNPVSFLQEYTVAKFRFTPVYEVIAQKTGTHINTFSIRVTCNKLSAFGIGSSKKEAKINAAKQMICLLNVNDNNSPCSSPLQTGSSEISRNNIQLLQKSPSTPVINYIGKLQELASNQSGGQLPEYEWKEVCGPSHDPQFTFVCKYQGFIEAAKGSTKKEAKMLAAQKMYEKALPTLQVVVPNTEVKSYLETISNGMEQMKIFEKNEVLMDNSKEKALKNYSQLSKTVVKKNAVEKDYFDKYYKLIKNTYSAKNLEEILNRLSDLMDANRNCITSGIKVANPKDLLKTILKDLNINVQEIIHKSGRNNCICSLRLDTNPVINEIGYGETQNQAELRATFLIAETLIILLI